MDTRKCRKEIIDDMKYMRALIAVTLIGGGIGILVSPAFNSGFAGYNLLGFVAVSVGLWPANIVLRKEYQ